MTNIRKHLAGGLIAVLLVSGFGGLANGLYYLTISKGWEGDLFKRWIEQKCVVNGLNPFSVYEDSKASRPALYVPFFERSGGGKGPQMHPGGYPPWSYLTGFLFVPPISFDGVRVYFACLNLLALAATLFWVFQTGQNLRPRERWLLTALAFAIFAHAVTLRLGQYGILINACLVLVVLKNASGNQIATGLALGIAAVKPQSAALFFLIPLVRQQWATFGVAVSYIVLGTIVVSAWVQTNPITIVTQMFQQAGEWDRGDAGLVGVFLSWGFPRTWVTLGGVVSGLGLTGILLWKYRNQPVLTLAAIPAVVGRLWMYHRRYDDLMLLFLLVPLGEIALRQRDRTAVLAFVLVGLSLVAPLRDVDQVPAIVLAKSLVWLWGLAVLLRKSIPEGQGSDAR